jgi:hypothetical protein
VQLFGFANFFFSLYEKVNGNCRLKGRDKRPSMGRC